MFQHSGETVSRHLHKVLIALLKLFMEYIRPLDPLFHDSHVKIENDTQYWSFFKNAIKAIDGTHVPCVVTPSEQARFIGRKDVNLGLQIIMKFSIIITLYKFETRVQIVCAVMTIYNFIRRNAKSDIDFTCYEDENISIDSNDNYHNIVNLD
uniref:DDE Tnp4 domain-containing protein n=1 Tax=Glycine max TaxID=3847 RepID=A0A0R0LFB5_SOYBN